MSCKTPLAFIKTICKITKHWVSFEHTSIPFEKLHFVLESYLINLSAKRHFLIIWFAEPYIICFLCIPNGIKWWWQVQSHFCIDLVLLCLCLFLYQPRSASWISLFFTLLAYQHSFSLSFGWWVIFLWRLFLGVHRKLFISFLSGCALKMMLWVSNIVPTMCQSLLTDGSSFPFFSRECAPATHYFPKQFREIC